jgi:hypothetical protein
MDERKKLERYVDHQRWDIIDMTRIAKTPVFKRIIDETVSLNFTSGTLLKKLNKHPNKNADALFHALLTMLNQELSPEEISQLHNKLNEKKLLGNYYK